MKKPKYSYDFECERLAEYFLAKTICTEDDKRQLSQELQDTVESWFHEWERKNVSASPEGE